MSCSGHPNPGESAVGKINYARVLIGGVVAGIVFVVTDMLGMRLMGYDMEAWMAQHGLTDPGIVPFIVMDILLGILVVWLYAAIRPRFGAGMRTALITAAWVWLFFAVIYFGWTSMGLFAQADYFKMAAWGVVQVVLAVSAGAWLYKEESGALAA